MKLRLAFAAFALASAFSLRANILISINPLTQTVAPGASASAQVRVSGLGLDAPPSLGAFDLNLAFNPAVVSFTGLTFGDAVLGDQLNLSGTGAISDVDASAAGLVEFFEISLDPAMTLDSLQSGSFVLATLQFQGVAPGSTSLVPSLNSISDSQGGPLVVGLQNGRIDVASTSTVPEPRLFAITGFGIAVLLICRRVKC